MSLTLIERILKTSQGVKELYVPIVDLYANILCRELAIPSTPGDHKFYWDNLYAQRSRVIADLSRLNFYAYGNDAIQIHCLNARDAFVELENSFLAEGTTDPKAQTYTLLEHLKGLYTDLDSLVATAPV